MGNILANPYNDPGLWIARQRVKPIDRISLFCYALCYIIIYIGLVFLQWFTDTWWALFIYIPLITMSIFSLFTFFFNIYFMFKIIEINAIIIFIITLFFMIVDIIRITVLCSVPPRMCITASIYYIPQILLELVAIIIAIDIFGRVLYGSILNSFLYKLMLGMLGQFGTPVPMTVTGEPI